jgi:hypothetical protein
LGSWLALGHCAASPPLRFRAQTQALISFQVVCCGSLLLALNFLKQVNNAYFRIGFNSLGAYGTINHLHFQVPLLDFHIQLAAV